MEKILACANLTAFKLRRVYLQIIDTTNTSGNSTLRALGPFHDTSFLPNGPNKLECYFTLGWIGVPRTNALAYWGNTKKQTRKRERKRKEVSRCMRHTISRTTYRMNSTSLQARVFDTVSQFYPSLIFVGQIRAYPGGAPLCAQVLNLAHKYEARVKVTIIDKHSILLHNRNVNQPKKVQNYNRTKSYSVADFIKRTRGPNKLERLSLRGPSRLLGTCLTPIVKICQGQTTNTLAYLTLNRKKFCKICPGSIKRILK